jgi:hypothetical protein
VAIRSGLDGAASVFAELLAWYRGWLAFLLACRNTLLTAWNPPAARVTVLCGTGAASVPGLSPAGYRVVPEPVLGQENPITPELAESVLAQFPARADAISSNLE